MTAVAAKAAGLESQFSATPDDSSSGASTSNTNPNSSGAVSSSNVTPGPRPTAKLPRIVVIHDYLNLAFIMLLNIGNGYFISTGKGFITFWWITMVYFIWDIAFVVIWPESVKAPEVIILHHVISALYTLIPYHHRQLDWAMAYCMLVEINTWLLIAKRAYRSIFLEIGFYASWVLLRNIMYPYLIYAFYLEWQYASRDFGTPWNWILVAPILQTALTGLNYYWTIDLLIKRSRKRVVHISPTREKLQ